MVYFIQRSTNGPIKIGVAGEPRKRLESLQTGSPEPLYLLGTLPGGKTEEAALHQKFGALLIRGEWFEPGDELIGFVAREAKQARRRWEELVAVEPRLKDLLIEAQQAEHLFLSDPNFCANDYWYHWDGGLRNRMKALVGFEAPTAPPMLRTTQAYDVAYKTLYEALPPCRDCCCM
jgi:hypothetical protein